MASRLFVVNEWLCHDLRGDNGPQAQRQAFRFLEVLKANCDRVVVLEESPWMQKAYELMTHTTPSVRKLSRYLRLNILVDPGKCRRLLPGDLPRLPASLEQSVPPDDSVSV